MMMMTMTMMMMTMSKKYSTNGMGIAMYVIYLMP